MNRGMTASGIKWVAMATMVLDHIAAAGLQGIVPQELWWMQLLRLVGRMAFPLFAFLLVEGFVHTRSVGRYAGRLAVFALLSEVPFDLAFAGRAIFWGWNNVFFTLLIGLGLLWCLERWSDRTAQVLMLLTACVLAELLCTDYGGAGVAAIAVLWLWRGRDGAFPAAVVLLTVLGGNLTELAALLAWPLVRAYSGRQGRRGGKYFFYAFYPVHLLVLTVLRALLLR